MTSLPGTVAEGFGRRFLDELIAVATRLDVVAVDRLAERLSNVRSRGGRVFVIGLGGGAANASHAACDLRALAALEAYAPTDSAASFTAAANDYGWREALSRWLQVSRITERDALLVLSVGGGSFDPPVSENLVSAIMVAREAGAFVCGVVGPDGGETASLADLCIRVPVEDRALRTTHTEIFQSVVWHMLVAHPALMARTPHWESLRP
jgi:D-sedoheptulose 7-phosphate isomerase